MVSCDLDQTIAAKYGFETLVLIYGVHVNQYHIENGTFVFKYFRDIVL